MTYAYRSRADRLLKVEEFSLTGPTRHPAGAMIRLKGIWLRHLYEPGETVLIAIDYRGRTIQIRPWGKEDRV